MEKKTVAEKAVSIDTETKASSPEFKAVMPESAPIEHKKPSGNLDGWFCVDGFWHPKN